MYVFDEAGQGECLVGEFARGGEGSARAIHSSRGIRTKAPVMLGLKSQQLLSGWLKKYGAR